MEANDWIGRFVLPVLLREEKLSYDVATVQHWEDERQRLLRKLQRGGWSPPTGLPPAADLQKARAELLLESFREPPGESAACSSFESKLRTATSFHEDLHFQQIIGTTFGRALFDLNSQRLEQQHAAAALALGGTSQIVWPKDPPVPLAQVQEDLSALDECLSYLLGLVPAQPRQPASELGEISGYYLDGKYVRSPIPLVTLEAGTYPLGGMVVLEGWAYALSQLVLETLGGPQDRAQYVDRKRKGDCWEYTVLQDSLSHALGAPLDQLDPRTYYTIVSRVAYFCLQVAFPIDTEKAIIAPGYLDTGYNHPGFRLVSVLQGLRPLPSDAFSTYSDASSILSALFRHIEQSLGWPDHRSVTVDCALQLLGQLVGRSSQYLPPKALHEPLWRALERPLHSRPAVDLYRWIRETYAVLQRDITRTALRAPDFLFNFDEWLVIWQTNISPWPPLMIYSEEREGGAPQRLLVFNGLDLRGRFDASLGVLLFVLFKVVGEIIATGACAGTCPLKSESIQWRCKASERPCDSGEEERFCPFEEAKRLIRGY